MKKLYILFCTAWLSLTGFAQYKYDNVLFKTVFLQDLCNELNSHPGAFLLDVRSPGEYADTSFMAMNLGRFKNAYNIEARELGKRIGEISNYKDKPVFVYCSHSQRSRRASKMLADSGFTQVFNINGGITGLRQLPAASNTCLYNKFETKKTYNIISATDLCNKISKARNDIFLLDVRDDSAFNHISPDARMNAYGYFKNTVHIPLADLEKQISNVPTGKEIIITDIFGDDATQAAELLKTKNYQNVSVLLEGYDRLLYTDPAQLPCMASAYVSKLPYKMINAQQLQGFLATTKEYLFLDARTTEEFTNKHKNYWQNLGHLQNAINIPAADISNQWAKIENYKTKPVIVYVFTGGAAAHETADALVKRGFTNVMVLQGGIFNIGWTAANIKGFVSLAGLRADIPAEN